MTVILLILALLLGPSVPALMHAPQTTSIQGRVYVDLNQNGHADPGEPGIETAYVGLFNKQQNMYTLFALPDAHGDYVLRDVPAGRYELTATVLGGSGSGTTDLVIQAGQNLTVDLATSQPQPSQLGMLYVHTWYDRNKNGRQEPDEPDAAGANISPTSGSGSSYYDADQHGTYVFVLRPGEYHVAAIWHTSSVDPPGVQVGRSQTITVEANKLQQVQIGFQPPLPKPTVPDWPIPDGHFYTQANGAPALQSAAGYAITNAGGIPFWDAYQAFGGPPILGYPSSQRFMLDGFVVQMTERSLLQWWPEQHRVVLANSFEIIERRNAAAVYYALGIPRAIKDDGAQGDLQRAKAIRMQWLANEAIKRAYLANPDPSDFPDWSIDQAMTLYGLPMSRPERIGPFISQRFQRAVFQVWVMQVPGGQLPGTVTRVPAGQYVAIFAPKEAAVPHLSPGVTP